MKTGVIGLGAMGGPMALNLHRAGLLRAAWNRTPERAVALAEEAKGLRLVTQPQALARECEVILISVADDGALSQVIERVQRHLGAGKVVVDTSTVSAETACAVAAQVAAVGSAFLDAPVSGGVEGARNAGLSMMVGGDAQALQRVRPVLSVVASHITYMGPVGSGQGTKAVNQVMVAGINQAVAESLAFAQALGLPMARVLEVVSAGVAANWLLSSRGARMVQQQYPAGFKVALHRKDLNICKQMAAALDVQLPTVEMTLIHYKRLLNAGLGDEDISALYQLKKAMFEKDHA
jgi:3-hydroxyisobutyrate dehydrogenase